MSCEKVSVFLVSWKFFRSLSHVAPIDRKKGNATRGNLAGSAPQELIGNIATRQIQRSVDDRGPGARSISAFRIIDDYFYFYLDF